jgi:hypothetical protein
MVTPAPAAKFCPVMATGVPPSVVPAEGTIDVTLGEVEEGDVPGPPHASGRSEPSRQIVR